MPKLPAPDIDLLLTYVHESTIASRSWRQDSWRDSEMDDGLQWTVKDWNDAIDAGIDPIVINRIFPVTSLIKGINIANKSNIKAEFIDNGIGIEDSRKKLIFLRGYNKDVTTTGMGFGLSLVKKIMDSYHGKIWVEDRVLGDFSKGSKFIILTLEGIESN